MTDKLRKVRKSKGITQQEMAEKLGFKSVSAYSAIERGVRKNLGVTRAAKIAEILETDVNELFFDQDLHVSGNGEQAETSA